MLPAQFVTLYKTCKPKNLKPCNIVNWTLRNKLQWNVTRNSYIFIKENPFENVVCEMASILSRPQCVNSLGSGVAKLSLISKILDPIMKPGPVFCLLLGVSSDYAQPITGQVTEVTCPVIGWAQPELTPSKRQKTGPGPTQWNFWSTSGYNAQAWRQTP